MADFLLKLLLHSSIIFAAFAQLKWTMLKDNSLSDGPLSRRDVAIGYDKKRQRLLIYGGKGNDTFDDTWAFHLRTRLWEKLTTSGVIGKRFSVVSGVWNDGFYVSTGQLGSDFFDDIWCLNLTTNVWRKLPQGDTPPEERYGSGGGFYQDSSFFYLTHGFASKRYSNTFRYDVSQNVGWEEVFGGTNSYNPNYPHARCLHSATMLGKHKLVMFGGCLGGGGTGGPCPADDNWRYDATKNSWKRLPHCASPREYSAMALLPSNGTNGTMVRAVLYGGDEGGLSVITVTKAPPNEVVVFNPDEDEWTKKIVDGTAPSKRVGHGMVTVDNGIIMFGGSSSEGLRNDVWLLEGTAEMVANTKTGDECNLLYFNFIHLHGIFMFISWGLLLQFGMFFARHFRHKDPLWFKVHRAAQVSGLVFSVIGLAFAIISVPFGHFMFAHAGIGLFIILVGLLQPLNAFFRPHKTDPKTLNRKIWEIFHINAGRLALILALINITLGLFLAVVPKAVWVTWAVIFAIWVAFLVIMEIHLQIKRYKSGSNSIEMANK